MSNKLLPLYACWLLLIGVLSACSNKPPISTVTPTPPYSIPSLMPRILDCQAGMNAQPGPTWNGLTIGVSTQQEVEAALSPVQPREKTFGGYLAFDKPVPMWNEGADEWHFVSVCFEDNILTAMDITPGVDSEFFKSLDEWVAAYGHPDRVTWGSFADYRSLIWAEKGLLAVMYQSSNPLIGIQTSSVILFPPIPSNELETSWLMEALPAEQWEHSMDTLLGDAEDPWGIEK